MYVEVVDSTTSSNLLAEVLRANFKTYKTTEGPQRFDLNYDYMSRVGGVVSFFKERLKSLGYKTMTGVRAHITDTGSYIESHIDTMVKGWDTAILTLSDEDSRFRYRENGVMHRLPKEPSFLVMDSGVLHEVVAGGDERISVICMAKKADLKEHFPLLELSGNMGLWEDRLEEAIVVSRLSGRDVTFSFNGTRVLVDRDTYSKTEFASGHSWKPHVDLRRGIRL